MSKSLLAIGNRTTAISHLVTCPEFDSVPSSYPEPFIPSDSYFVHSQTSSSTNPLNFPILCSQRDLGIRIPAYESHSRRQSIASTSSIHMMDEFNESGLDGNLIDIHEGQPNPYSLHVRRMSNASQLTISNEKTHTMNTVEQGDIGFSVPSQDFQVPEYISFEDYYSSEKYASLHNASPSISSMSRNLDDQLSSDNSSPGFMDIGDYFECPDVLSTDTYLEPEVVHSSTGVLIPSQIVSSMSVKSHFPSDNLFKGSTVFVPTRPRKTTRSQKSPKHAAYGSVIPKISKQPKSKKPSTVQQCISSNERPYTCEYCGHCFARKHDMLRHRRKHTGQKPYPCESCGESFYRTDVRQRHYQNEPKCWAEMMRNKSLMYHY